MIGDRKLLRQANREPIEMIGKARAAVDATKGEAKIVHRVNPWTIAASLTAQRVGIVKANGPIAKGKVIHRKRCLEVRRWMIMSPEAASVAGKKMKAAAKV